jgi:hypothetical protein
LTELTIRDYKCSLNLVDLERLFNDLPIGSAKLLLLGLLANRLIVGLFKEGGATNSLTSSFSSTVLSSLLGQEEDWEGRIVIEEDGRAVENSSPKGMKCLVSPICFFHLYLLDLKIPTLQIRLIVVLQQHVVSSVKAIWINPCKGRCFRFTFNEK